MVLLQVPEILLLSLLLSFAAAFLAVPFVMRNSRRVGLTGKDQNKPDRREVPEMGGIAIVFAISLGFLTAIALGYNNDGIDKVLLLGSLGTVLSMGLLGAVDDVFALKKSVKAPIPFLSAIPLSAVRAGHRIMNLPFAGSVNLGAWYPLAVVPLGVGGASNAFNMLAGLNGLEAGMGIIISLAIALAALHTGAVEALVISVSLLGALLAFLYYNRYPAKVFPGDAGTYTIGATIACAVIVGNLELLGVALFVPYFFELALKARTGLRGQSFGIVQQDGTLKPPAKKTSLTHFAMSVGRLKEPQVVGVLLAMECLVAVTALAALFVR
ncbi:MAG: glycosyltransferase 4 family protein [Candidatus Micrarchaeota archaeon]